MRDDCSIEQGTAKYYLNAWSDNFKIAYQILLTYYINTT